MNRLVWHARLRGRPGAVATLALLLGAGTAAADTVKIGNILALTGDGAAIGQHIQQGEALYVKLHKADLPAGTDIELITRDDGSKPDNTRRLAQELIVRDHVQMIAGITLSPQGFAIAPVLTEAKVPAVLMNATTGSITRSSPYIVRFSHSNWQMAYSIGQWAAKNNIKSAYTLVADYAAGTDMEAAFKRGFGDAGGSVVGSDRTPLSTTDYLPYMQRVKAAKPQALFIFEIAGPATIAVFKAFGDAGLREAGVLAIGSGDVVPDDELSQTGEAALGMVDASIYTTAVKTPGNEAFVAAWTKEYGASAVPSFEAVAGWNGMAAIFEAVKALGVKATGDAALEILAHYKNPDAPQGPMSIDPETHDIVQNVYLAKVQKSGSGFVNAPFDTIKDVKDPWKLLNPK
jgi:branched-chain amino acid transport system substrate-binding protein